MNRDHETISHLFFEYCVAVNVWRNISEVLCVDIGHNYESVAKLWIANKKHLITNVVYSAVLWYLWKLRNELCFQSVVMAGNEDDASSDCKNAERMDISLQEGSWRVAGRPDRQVGGVIQAAGTDQVDVESLNGVIITVGSIWVLSLWQMPGVIRMWLSLVISSLIKLCLLVCIAHEC